MAEQNKNVKNNINSNQPNITGKSMTHSDQTIGNQTSYRAAPLAPSPFKEVLARKTESETRLKHTDGQNIVQASHKPHRERERELKFCGCASAKQVWLPCSLSHSLPLPHLCFSQFSKPVQLVKLFVYIFCGCFVWAVVPFISYTHMHIYVFFGFLPNCFGLATENIIHEIFVSNNMKTVVVPSF